METDISKLHEGTDGFYYDDFLAPDKAETFVGQLVSTQWWQKGGRFALICNFLAEDGGKSPCSPSRNTPALRAGRRGGQFQARGDEYLLGV